MSSPRRGAEPSSAISSMDVPTAVSLGLDLIHYLVATMIWGRFRRYHELRLKKPSDDPILEASRYLNWPTHCLFALKQSALVWAWAGILKYLFFLWRNP